MQSMEGNRKKCPRAREQTVAMNRVNSLADDARREKSNAPAAVIRSIAALPRTNSVAKPNAVVMAR
jgi:hypothetical protein